MLDFYKEFRDFKAFEIRFTDSGSEESKIFCKIKSIENNALVVDADNILNKNVLAKVADELRVYIYTENGIYAAVSKVLSIVKGTSHTEYVIEYPKSCKHSQRREYFRADLNVDFNLEITQKDSEKEPIHIEGKTKNICGKGMCYISNKPFPEHESVEVVLHFPEKEVKTMATFVYSKQIGQGSHPKFINAFAFTTIKTRDIDLVVKKCFLYQLDLRKQSAEID